MSKEVKTRRRFAPEFKMQVALAAIRGEGSDSEIATKFKLQAGQVAQWKKTFLENAQAVFDPKHIEEESSIRISEEAAHELYEKIGQLVVESNLFSQLLLPH